MKTPTASSKNGYSLIELMLAAALSMIVIGSSSSLIYKFFVERKNMEVWSSSQIETSFSLRDLDGDIRNVIRLDPVESLLNDDSEAYFGLSEVPPSAVPSQCLRDERSSVFRYTSLNRLKKSERMLRAWSETGDADKTDAANELRLTIDTGNYALFTNEDKPQELVLVDADRRNIRRYRVAFSTDHLQTNLDPYDDKPKVDANLHPVLFDYRSVFLKMPLNAQGAPTPKKTAVFITGSEVYASHTFFVCLSKTDRSLIKFDQDGSLPQVLVQNPNVDFEIDSFIASYMATHKGLRVEDGSFFTDMLASPLKNCVNTLHLDLVLKASTAFKNRNQNETLVDKHDLIHRTRTIYSENITAKRPVSCTNAYP